MNNLFVKFVPWNEKTLSGIINKTIKFSTVYEFNDFNEYGYIVNSNTNITEENHSILEKELASSLFLNNLLTFTSEVCNEEYKNKFSDFIKSGNARQLLKSEENCLNLLQENLAFSSVGIFCISELNVFEDDSAQLMFAHYAENLKGIALIYEIPDSQKIKYLPKRLIYGMPISCFEWYKGNYKHMENFLNKSKKWEYENERRIFGKPGITSAKEHNIILRAILYTPRFSDEEKTLFAINDKIYDGNLIIEGIYPSYLKHYFMMKRNSSKAIDFLQNTFCDALPLPSLITRQVEYSDIDAMISLSKTKRLAYEKAQPQFWRYNGVKGDNAQKNWFKELLNDENYLMFIAETDAKEIQGFIIGKIVSAPEVYAPGGQTLMIDDFCVQSGNLWQSVGLELIKAVKAAAKTKGAAQVLVVCGAHDHQKRKFLTEQKLSIASEWFVGGIV